MSLQSIALLTYEGQIGFATDDQLLVTYLKQTGFRVSAVPWENSVRKLREFDAVVFRSTWNYHKSPDEFKIWLNTLEMMGLNLWNPLPVIRWNMSKSYLLDLHQKDVPIPAFKYVRKDTEWELDSFLQKNKWQKVVIKPAISATAYNTFPVTRQEAQTANNRINLLLAESDLIVQEFMEEVITDGEYSFIFFGNRYSHAVKKIPKKGDFRVQADFGGNWHPCSPSVSLINQAKQILMLVEEDLLYARVDGVVRQGLFYLMELELIEPALFFGAHPEAARRFTQVLLSRYQNQVKTKKLLGGLDW